jgi:hypothetical protein
MNDTEIGITLALLGIGAILLGAGWGVHYANSEHIERCSHERDGNATYQKCALAMAVTGAALLALPVLKMIKLYVLG